MEKKKFLTADQLESSFRESVLRAVNTRLFNPNLPRASFVKIFNIFRKKVGRTKTNESEFNYFWNIYLKVLKSCGKEVPDFSGKVKTGGNQERRETIVTPAMKKGARKRQYQLDRMGVNK